MFPVPPPRDAAASFLMPEAEVAQHPVFPPLSLHTQMFLSTGKTTKLNTCLTHSQVSSGEFLILSQSHSKRTQEGGTLAWEGMPGRSFYFLTSRLCQIEQHIRKGKSGNDPFLQFLLCFVYIHQGATSANSCIMDRT